jgi:hypothetical protein
MSPTPIIICLQTKKVHRNSYAPCDYTYTGHRKQGIFTSAFLDTEGVSFSNLCDITKAATWNGLEILSSNELAPYWVIENLQPRSEETLWRGMWPRAVRRKAFYYPIAVKPGCKRRQTQEWKLYGGVCVILLSGKKTKNVSQILQKDFSMEIQW